MSFLDEFDGYFPTPYSPLPTPHSLLPTPYSLISLATSLDYRRYRAFFYELVSQEKPIMDALSNLIKNHPFNGNDDEILSAYRNLSQKEWDFIIAEIGFDPREEDPEASEFDHAEFISCEVGDHLLDVIESNH